MRQSIWIAVAFFCGTTMVTSINGAEDTPKKEREAPKPFDDADFVKKAASGGMHEVELGKMAAEKGKMESVKSFGQKMVDDHSKANDELMKVAKANKFVVPETMLDEHQKAFDKFKGLTGEEFDRAYVNHMVKDHDMDVEEFTRASKDAKVADIRDFAVKTLPTLRMHQKMIKEIQSKLK